jgi:predicted amidohydrolase
MATVALAQTSATADVARNVAQADRLIAEAAERGADLVAFPEVFLYVGPRERKRVIAEPLDGPLLCHFRDVALRHRIAVLVGSMHERIPGDAARVFNTSVLLAEDGRVLAAYRKRRLFDVELGALRIKESDDFVPGDEDPPVVDTRVGRVALTICFDVRFPELYQRARACGAEVVFVPSNFTVPTGAAHWEVLLRARAIENQVYVVAPAQWGPHEGGHSSYGASMVVDPWGTVIARAPDVEGLILATLDLDYLHAVRRALPMRAPGAAPLDADASAAG